jgi:uncharacterized protein (TIGR02145 family)
MITFNRVQLSDIFREMRMVNEKVKLFAVALSFLGLTGCHTNSIRDIEDNTYKIVTIGTQVWMAENLKTTKYNDGTEIPMVVDNDEWAKLITPAFSWYNSDQTDNKKTYGALYNWFAVNTNKLCPAGWHVSTDGDWVTLVTFLLGGTDVGGKLKEKGTAHWKSPNTGATNESSFTALPGGYRSFEGAFNYISISGYWWSSTEYNEANVLFWNLRYKVSGTFKYRSEKNCGFSVRCVQDK